MVKIIFLLLVFVIIGFISLKTLERRSFHSRHQLPYQSMFPFLKKTMSYQVLGRGQPIILLHGSMVSASWGGFEKKLAEHYQVFMPDLPGFGASDAVDGRIHNSDLFSQYLCTFIRQLGLTQAPIISLSFGTIVSAKTAASGCTDGQLFFIGAPTKITGIKPRLLQAIPLSWRRILISFRLAKDKLLIPSLYQNIGNKIKSDNSQFIQDLETTDVRSLVDINYFREINHEFPAALKKVTNKIIYFYGANDPQKLLAQEEFIEIKNSRHNIFVDQPDDLLAAIQTFKIRP